MNRQLRRMQAKQEAVEQRKQQSAQVRQQAQKKAVQEQKRVGTRQFTREVIGEMRKVLWPTQEQVRNSTLVVLVTVFLLTGYIYIADTLFNSLIFEVVFR